MEVPLRALAPRWLFRLTFKLLRRINEAFNTMSNFAMSQINARKNHKDNEKIGICNSIVQANGDRGKSNLSEGEVLGDTFAVLIAGHGGLTIPFPRSNHSTPSLSCSVVIFNRYDGFDAWFDTRFVGIVPGQTGAGISADFLGSS